MYKQFSKQEWLKILKLPNDYAVDSVVITGTPIKSKHLEIVREVIDEIGVNYSIKDFENIDFVRSTEIKINNKIIWFDTSYGSAYLSEIVHIASILGSKQNILLGSCGGLSFDAKSLDLIVPTYSFGNESTTRFYDRENKTNNHYSNKDLSKNLENLFMDKYTVHNGTVMTCQAHLSETIEDIQKWSKEGYLGVEMESASMFAVSNHFGVPSTAVLHINDNLIEKEYVGSEVNISKKQRKKDLVKDKYRKIFKYLINNQQ